jgi:hypothetical protein
MKVRSVAWKVAGQLSCVWLFICAVGWSQTVWARGGGKATAVISGSVRDERGNPLAGAVVSILREGASKAVRQVRSAADGSFRARIAPGRYVLSAIATGFSQVSFTSVNARSSQELVYRFNLTPVGAGRTLPETRRDRDSSKWIFRSVFGRRSIFQIQEEDLAALRAAINANEPADKPDGETPAEEPDGGAFETAAATPAPNRRGRARGVVESYFSSDGDSVSQGVNFALATPAFGNLTFVFAGQTGTGAAPQRLETTAQMRLNENHQVSVRAGAMRLSSFLANDVPQREMGQISVRAVDEWTMRNGVVVVLGMDYARFVGAGSNAARVIKPRFGIQFDPNPRTRLRAGLTPGDDPSATPVQVGEGEQISFNHPNQQAVAFVGGQPVLERSRRLEFGVERVLDNASSIEATGFFDTADGRGVGLAMLPLSSFDGAALNSVALQEGAARGVRLVYKRHFGSLLTASAGYAFGRGQQLNAAGLNNPAQLFTGAGFQTAALQVGANPWRGTRIHTVLRFSPRATVFAIDPLAGRLAVYDPSLSVLLTQELPTFGLPVRAEALIDARNLLDAATGADDGERSLTLSATRRTLRGGILVRF